MKTLFATLAAALFMISCKPVEDSKPASAQKVSQETAEEQVLIEKTLVSMMQRNVDNLRSDLERTKDAGPAALKAEDLRRKMDELEARKAKLAKWEAALDAAGE